MTGFESKRDAAADKYALFQKFEVAQPAQEPVAWMVIGNGKFGEYELGQVFVDYEGTNKYWVNRGYELVPVYTEPPQREWVGLTDEEYDEIWRMDLNNKELMDKTIIKLKEKNNGT